MCYWDPKHIDLEDTLNGEIWKRSPCVQKLIQKPDDVNKCCDVGAQQVMITNGLVESANSETVLEWIPDFVGRNWCHKDSLMIVGSAYAGIIKEYSPRNFPLKDYVTASSWSQFQQKYVRKIMEGDKYYYDRLKSLCHGVVRSSADVCLFDLCRASFVMRFPVKGKGRRRDKNGDGIVRDNGKLFSKYVESTCPREWLWKRIVSSKARRIVALGSIAEHGLIRLFHYKGMSFSFKSQDMDNFTYRKASNANWAKDYADPSKKISSWIANNEGNWWVIRGSVKGQDREWHLLPVFHPSAAYKASHDKNYQESIKIINRM